MAGIFTQILDVRLGVYEGEVTNLAKKLVGATLAVYKFACESLRPTPLKVHYTFNLRDFSKATERLALQEVRLDQPVGGATLKMMCYTLCRTLQSASRG